MHIIYSTVSEAASALRFNPNDPAPHRRGRRAASTPQETAPFRESRRDEGSL